MKPHFIKTASLIFVFLLSVMSLSSQQIFTLKQSLEYAVENNRNLKKSHYDKEKAAFARREVLGALLPQISGSANLNDNLEKSKFIMPNFINSMLPPSAQDPDAAKYMTIEMGTNFNANAGVSLIQQVINFSLFNTLEIAKAAEKMAVLGVESSEEEVIYQTANLFYAIQSAEYAVVQMEKSVELVSKMLVAMEVNYKNGLVKKVDVDRLKVNLVNLTTQKSTMINRVDVQKNLLKLQMGFEINNPIKIQPISIVMFEEKAKSNTRLLFDIEGQTSYRLLMERCNMANLQKKSAVFENLPTLSLMFNYQYSGVSDEFFRGETNYWYPTSVVGLNLKVPIFSGGSRRAKIQQNSMEIRKNQEEIEILEQSLNMTFINAQMKLDDACNTIILQRENQNLAEEVFSVAENNYVLGLSSMSDILNASQSLVQAQMSYANALNDYLKAHIEQLKATGHLHNLLNEE